MTVRLETETTKAVSSTRTTASRAPLPAARSTPSWRRCITVVVDGEVAALQALDGVLAERDGLRARRVPENVRERRTLRRLDGWPDRLRPRADLRRRRDAGRDERWVERAGSSDYLTLLTRSGSMPATPATVSDGPVFADELHAVDHAGDGQAVGAGVGDGLADQLRARWCPSGARAPPSRTSPGWSAARRSSSARSSGSTGWGPGRTSGPGCASAR